MAKIAIISTKMNPQTLGLAQALQFHRHEVMIITSFNEEVPDGINYQVLRYFKTWSAFEAIKFFPHLLGQSPEIWHFVFANDGSARSLPRGAHWLLAQMAKALPRRVVAASFYESLFDTPSRKLTPMLKSIDIVTTATREQLMFIKRRSWIKSYCETEVLPPFAMSSTSESKKEIDSDLMKLLQSMQPYLVIPSERISPRISEDPLFTDLLKKKNLVICGSRQKMKLLPLGFKTDPPEIAFVGSQPSPDIMKVILKNSQGLLCAFDEFSAVELLQFHRLCQQTETALIAHPRQAEALPGICINSKNGFILENGMTSLQQLLDQNPNLTTDKSHYQSINTDLTDSALNELNRLYAKVQHLKTSAIDMKRTSLS